MSQTHASRTVAAEQKLDLPALQSPALAQASKPALTVYYDGACPLCRREIDFYRRRRGADRIAWVDVGRAQGPVVDSDLSVCDALSRFHVRTNRGRLISGGRAFAEIWANLPGFRPLGRLLRAPPLALLLEGLYRVFLRVRPGMQRIAAHLDKSGRAGGS